MKRITLSNDFHNTEITLHVKDNTISAGQVKKARRELCGISGCTCGNDLGMRGKQQHHVDICQDRDGKIFARLID